MQQQWEVVYAPQWEPYGDIKRERRGPYTKQEAEKVLAAILDQLYPGQWMVHNGQYIWRWEDDPNFHGGQNVLGYITLV